MNSACVKQGLHYLQVRQELLFCWFLGGLPAVQDMIRLPLEKVLYRQIMKYSPEDPVLGQPMEVPVRKVGMRHYSSTAHSPRASERAAFSFRVSFLGWTLEAYSPLCASSSGPSHVVQIDLVWSDPIARSALFYVTMWFLTGGGCLYCIRALVGWKQNRS